MTKGTVISIDEALHFGQEHNLYQWLLERYHDGLQKSDRIVLYCLNEQINSTIQPKFFRYLLPAVVKLSNDFKQQKPLLLMNLSISHVKSKHKVTDFFDIIEIEPFRLYTYFQNNFNKDYTVSPLDAVPLSEKYLCKFGKFNREHSVLIFVLLKESNLLDESKGLWSLALSDDDEFKESMNSVCHPNRDDYLNYQRTLDIDFTDHFSNGTLHYTGFPFEKSHYSDTRFSIVRETNWGPQSEIFMSEKTWIPISMKHPFMLFSTKAQSKYMTEAGYQSPDNFEMCDFSAHWTSFPEAKEKFLECYNKFMSTPIPELQQIVNHNFDLYISDVKKDINKLMVPITFVNRFEGDNLNNLLELVLKIHYPNADKQPLNSNFDFKAIRQAFS